MPLTFANESEQLVIKRISGTDEVRRHLHNLGFVEDANIYVVSKSGGNLIVVVKDTRVAISKEMAGKIVVDKA